MDDYSTSKKSFLSISSFLLALYVAISFLYHFFSSFRACTFLFFAVVILKVISQKSVLLFSQQRKSYLFSSILLVLLLVEYLLSSRAAYITIDIGVMSICLISLLFCNQNLQDYIPAMKTICVFAGFFAIGIFIQILFPGFYRSVMAVLLPGSNQAQVVFEESTGYRGFSTNTGFTAGHICAGLIAAISQLSSEKSVNRKKHFFALFLLIALLLTGKRGHMLFLVLSILLSFLLPARGGKKIKRIFTAFFILLVIVILYFLFSDFLIQIPGVRAIVETINGTALGEDMTTGRTRLYSWAWTLFKENPIFGIGWGVFQTTTIGNATTTEESNCHNIYLQLLCETGVIGFAIFILFFFYFWNSTKNAFCRLANAEPGKRTLKYNLLFFSLTYQSFFLLYGLTGNPLYDQNFQIMYFFACMISSSYCIWERSSK